MKKETIPAQKKGASFDVRETRSVDEREEAKDQYLAARERLFNVYKWGDYANEASGTFILTDALGNELERAALEGDHIKIHLPGPRSTQGDGADWVVIEKNYGGTQQAIGRNIYRNDGKALC